MTGGTDPGTDGASAARGGRTLRFMVRLGVFATLLAVVLQAIGSARPSGVLFAAADPDLTARASRLTVLYAARGGSLLLALASLSASNWVYDLSGRPGRWRYVGFGALGLLYMLAVTFFNHWSLLWQRANQPGVVAALELLIAAIGCTAALDLLRMLSTDDGSAERKSLWRTLGRSFIRSVAIPWLVSAAFLVVLTFLLFSLGIFGWSVLWIGAWLAYIAVVVTMQADREYNARMRNDGQPPD